MNIHKNAAFSQRAGSARCAVPNSEAKATVQAGPAIIAMPFNPAVLAAIIFLFIIIIGTTAMAEDAPLPLGPAGPALQAVTDSLEPGGPIGPVEPIDPSTPSFMALQADEPSAPQASRQNKQGLDKGDIEELEERLARLERNLGNLTIRGSLGIEAQIFTGNMPHIDLGYEDTGYDTDDGEPQEEDFWEYMPTPKSPTAAGLSQDLDLYLSALISPNAAINISMGNRGMWGAEMLSEMPVVSSPLTIDEATLRFVYPDKGLDLTLGRQRYHLGPVGLISSGMITPVEGLNLAYGDEIFKADIIAARLTSVYYPASYYVVDRDDLLLIRGERSDNETGKGIGLNALVSGLGDEQGLSLDFMTDVGEVRVWGEAALYKPYSSWDESAGSVEGAWLPGIVLGAGLIDTPVHALEVKAGYISDGFAPIFSSLATSTLGNYEIFRENTFGVEAKYSRRIGDGSSITVRASRLNFIDKDAAEEKANYDQIMLNRVNMEIMKSLSQNLSLSAYMDHNSNGFYNYQKYGLSLNAFF